MEAGTLNTFGTKSRSPIKNLPEDAEDLLHDMCNLVRQGLVERLKQLIRERLDETHVLINTVADAELSCLHQAARRHDLECVKTLIEYGKADVNLKAKDGLTPLHFAAKYEKILPKDQPRKKSVPMTSLVRNAHNINEPSNEIFDEIIQYLYRSGANLEKPDQNGMTALHYAASRNNLSAARQLIMLGAYLECKDNENMTPLLLAVRDNHLDAVQMLLNAGTNGLTVDRYGCNILHHACHNGDVHVLDFLQTYLSKTHGSDCTVGMLNSVNNKGQTPVHLAILSKSAEITEICIQLGADLSIQTNKGESVLHLAARSGNIQVAEMLLDRGSAVNAIDNEGRTPIFDAIQCDHPYLMEVLLHSGAKIDHLDKEEITPLLLAAKLGRLEICRILLDLRASVDVEDKRWRTPLHLAVEGKHRDLVELLQNTEEGYALIEREDIGQNRPIHAAVRTGSLAVTKFLLDAGANVIVKNANEHTPLHVAAIYGRFGIVELLLTRTPLVAYERDEDGNYAVHLAAKHGFTQVLKVILERTHQLDERNTSGWTPLTFAAGYNRPECVKLLIDQGAKIDSMDKSNMTPLFMACRGGHVDVVNLLLDAGADPGLCVTMYHKQYAGWNALDIAIDANQFACVQAILKSNMWESALRNETYENRVTVNTPLRKMISDMPAAAEIALSRCIQRNSAPRHAADHAITFKFEFLDDCMGVDETRSRLFGKIGAHESDMKSLLATEDIEHNNDEVTANSGGLKEHFVLDSPAKTKQNQVVKVHKMKRVHPVKEMLLNDREDLLNHQLVLALLAFKWSRFCFLYYGGLVAYVLFLCLFSAFMLQTQPPYMFYPEKNMTTVEICELLRNTSTKAYSYHITVPKYGVLVLSVICLLLEISQFVRARLRYITLGNLLEVTIYSLALCTTTDTNWCMHETGLRAKWQWATGSVGIFLAWVNLLLFIRSGLKVGIFVIMFVVVMKTFAKFFLVFSPFLFAFALSFHALLANQIPFRDLKNAVVKTFGMVIGELDTNTIIFERFESTDVEKQVYFATITYIIFVGFISIMSIVMMNLLVGLAVDDIKGVQRKAQFKRQEMRIELIFSAESLLSRFGRKTSTLRNYIYRPNNPSGYLSRMFHRFYVQSMKTAKEIAEIQFDDDEVEVTTTRKSPEKRLEEIQAQIVQLARTMNQLVDRVNSGAFSSQLEGNIQPRMWSNKRVVACSGTTERRADPIKRLAVDDDLDEEPVQF
ncbi:Transient receptor putative cation channel sub A member 1 [Clonorchis sinensis]|uniref:Transient receptor putative cation channel sub A member 1 n=2 Tax=Clonorchis sinensis TaxID=79923 RepID=A0A8T1MVK5_CLOSI|nr:Transient receptor putative cation channel sub A member 1 [Clonorchis sinensis]